MQRGNDFTRGIRRLSGCMAVVLYFSSGASANAQTANTSKAESEFDQQLQMAAAHYEQDDTKIRSWRYRMPTNSSHCHDCCAISAKPIASFGQPPLRLRNTICV